MKLSTCVASRILTPFVASLTLLSLIPTELPAAEPTELSAAEPTELFQRRFIVNDDGEVLLPKAGGSWDAYLGERFADTRSTQVTTYFLNVGATDRGPGIVDSLQSTMAYWADGKGAQRPIAPAPTPGARGEAATWPEMGGGKAGRKGLGNAEGEGQAASASGQPLSKEADRTGKPSCGEGES